MRAGALPVDFTPGELHEFHEKVVVLLDVALAEPDSVPSPPAVVLQHVESSGLDSSVEIVAPPLRRLSREYAPILNGRVCLVYVCLNELI